MLRHERLASRRVHRGAKRRLRFNLDQTTLHLLSLFFMPSKTTFTPIKGGALSRLCFRYALHHLCLVFGCVLVCWDSTEDVGARRDFEVGVLR